MGELPQASVALVQAARSAPPTDQTRSPSSSPAIGSSAPTGPSPATAVVLRARNGCSITKHDMPQSRPATDCLNVASDVSRQSSECRHDAPGLDYTPCVVARFDLAR